MATIDIRASVTCSLGTLISGSLSDDYLQGSGLVMTRGECELSGLVVPDVGTAVTFSYAGPAGTETIPRQLLVLSSFADPYRETTKVELGCRLTYLKDVGPEPEVDSAEETGWEQACRGGFIDYGANSPVGFPIRASGVMDTCLGKLGITASSNPLTNVFTRDAVDLSGGYVQVLGDLLLSEGYVGYMDGGGTLQVRDLSVEGGSGPQVTSDHIVNLGAIGVGDLPGEAVVVRYDTAKPKGDIDASASPGKRNWEEDETKGSPQTITIRYSSDAGNASAGVTYIPHSTTKTVFAEELKDSGTCTIGSSRKDRGGQVLSRETEERVIIAQSAANYCSEVLSAGGLVDIGFAGKTRRLEEYEYDADGELVKLTSYVYEPHFSWLGRIDVDYVYAGTNGTPEFVNAFAQEVLVEKTVQEYTTIYDRKRTTSSSGKVGKVYEPVVLATKTKTTVYENWMLTQSGQQGAAQIKESAPFQNVAEAESWLNGYRGVLIMTGSEVRTNRTRETAGQWRPADVGNTGGNAVPTEGKLAYAMGSAASTRFKVFSMPYQSDGYYLSNGSVVSGDAEAKALRFGRIQNGLLLGNRNGINLQLHPSKMPPNPFDPLYLTKDGLTVQYRANGIAWAFDANGIVASVDALYWGIAGGTGTPWVPVAPGVTTFPPAPPVVGGEINVPSVVPPWNETVPFKGVTRTVAKVADYSYSFGSVGSEAIVAVTKTLLDYDFVLTAEAGSFTLTGGDSGATYEKGMAANAGGFTLAGGPVADLPAPPKTLDGEAAIFVLTGEDAVLEQKISDPYGANVALLLHFEDPAYSWTTTDSSSHGHTVTGMDNDTDPSVLPEDQQTFVDPAQFRFGSSSGFTWDNNARWDIPDHPSFNLANNDFTFECWMRPRVVNDNFFLLAKNTTSSTEFDWAFAAYAASGTTNIFNSSSNSLNVSWTTLSPFVANTWAFIVIQRNGDNFHFWKDGIKHPNTRTWAGYSFPNSASSVHVGARMSADTTTFYAMRGWLDEVRLTNGVARYPLTDFTPPTAPFPDP